MKQIPAEIYSRVSGYFRPVGQWNKGKQEEFKDRKTGIIKEVQCGNKRRGKTDR